MENKFKAESNNQVDAFIVKVGRTKKNGSIAWTGIKFDTMEEAERSAHFWNVERMMREVATQIQAMSLDDAQSIGSMANDLVVSVTTRTDDDNDPRGWLC